LVRNPERREARDRSIARIGEEGVRGGMRARRFYQPRATPWRLYDAVVSPLRTLCLLLALGSGFVACASPSEQGTIAARNAAEADGLPTTADELPQTDVEGFEALLASLRNTPVVVNVWASWCEPCIREAPILTDAHARYGDRVQFLGVDIMDARDGARRFIDEHGIEYPSVFDPANAIGVDRGVFAPPATIVFGPDGTQVATLPGELSRDALEDAIAEALG
jgi:thiol-disulfide isomerase/thioredoxin